MTYRSFSLSVAKKAKSSQVSRWIGTFFASSSSSPFYIPPIPPFPDKLLQPSLSPTTTSTCTPNRDCRLPFHSIHPLVCE